MTLAPVLPVRVSLKAVPVRFSKLTRVSTPAPMVFWAVVEGEVDGHPGGGAGLVAGGIGARGPAVHGVVARAAVERVVADRADQRVIAGPAARLSLPAPPFRTLARVLPVRVSLKLEPVRFSIVARVSTPAPTVFWAVAMARLTVTAAVAPA